MSAIIAGLIGFLPAILPALLPLLIDIIAGAIKGGKVREEDLQDVFKRIKNLAKVGLEAEIEHKENARETRTEADAELQKLIDAEMNKPGG